MKTLIAVVSLCLACIIVGCCTTRTTDYKAEKKFTYKRNGVIYTVTDTYTRTVTTDTIKQK